MSITVKCGDVAQSTVFDTESDICQDHLESNMHLSETYSRHSSSKAHKYWFIREHQIGDIFPKLDHVSRLGAQIRSLAKCVILGTPTVRNQTCCVTLGKSLNLSLVLILHN